MGVLADIWLEVRYNYICLDMLRRTRELFFMTGSGKEGCQGLSRKICHAKCLPLGFVEAIGHRCLHHPP